VNITVSGELMQHAIFFAFAALAIFGALRVVTASDPFVSALSLLFNFVSLGVLYLLLGQDFVAISQILVYAGSVIVMFLFVIAYLGDRRELFSEGTRLPRLRPLAIAASVVLGALLVGTIFASTMPTAVDQPADTAAGHSFGSASAIGETFMTTYLLAFEVTSIVLLVAAIGGIVLGLTGRARLERVRKLTHTRSADSQRRAYEQSDDTTGSGA
jgi:NADH:ubiquinone oxidoreductase subunit 6 (subunit J)